MEQMTLEINLVSAQRLKNVNLMSKMDVYASVSISGVPNHPSDQSFTSPVDRTGGDNPTWNFPVKFTVDAEQNHHLSLVVKLRCERGLLSDKDVGEVVVPIKELLDGGGRGTLQFVSYQIRRPSGKSGGELTFSYKFNDQSYSDAAKSELVKSDEPAAVSAYPAIVMGPTSTSYSGEYPPPPPTLLPAVAAGYGCHPPPPPVQYVCYPPAPPAGYGYSYYPPPPPAGYGYPPVQATGYGYGYPPSVVQPQKKNKFGMGLGAGLLGGALGGLLIGDAVSDVAAYDVGYDSGFADAGGFGF